MVSTGKFINCIKSPVSTCSFWRVGTIQNYVFLIWAQRPSPCCSEPKAHEDCLMKISPALFLYRPVLFSQERETKSKGVGYWLSVQGRHWGGFSTLESSVNCISLTNRALAWRCLESPSSGNSKGCSFPQRAGAWCLSAETPFYNIPHFGTTTKLPRNGCVILFSAVLAPWRSQVE